MTNSKTITPFCCDMSDASEQQIRDLHKMCIDTGATEYDTLEDWIFHMSNYNFMGVDDCNVTASWSGYIDVDNGLLPLEHVSSHLGLTAPEVDKPLVEGTLQHAYIDLRGDLNNCFTFSAEPNKEYLLYLKGNGIYFLSAMSASLSEYTTTVCTVKEFQEYCEQQSYVSPHTDLNQPVTGFTTEPNESHAYKVEPLKWTEECQSQGIPFQVDMQVSIDSANVQGEFNIVTAIGDEFVLLKVGNIEWCVRKEEVLPYKEMVITQRDKVIRTLKDSLNLDPYVYDEGVYSTVYDELLSIGVFKEEV